jgi:hypothetical protein
MTFNEVWGISRSDVWAVGNDPTVHHFDGASWSIVNLPVTF